MAPTKFDLMKDMDAVLREAERERARAAAVRQNRTGSIAAALAARPAFAIARPLPTVAAFAR